eukprot:2143276-Rhodomonas_salina.1
MAHGPLPSTLPRYCQPPPSHAMTFTEIRYTVTRRSQRGWATCTAAWRRRDTATRPSFSQRGQRLTKRRPQTGSAAPHSKAMLKRTVQWYEAAARQAHPQAICTLGYCYAKGDGVAKDEKSALKLFMRASQMLLPEAQYNLAVCYAKGRGTQRDPERAVEMYRKAAQNGHSAAKCNL